MRRSWIVLAFVCACACSTNGPVRIPETSTVFDAIEPTRLVEFRAARAAFDARDVALAHERFSRLLELDPSNICVGAWLQECEFARGDAAPAIAARWAERASRATSAANEVLSARVATSAAARDEALSRAEKLDASCAWVHYARGFEAAGASDWATARAHLARAKTADPGHVWSFWLEAWIATRTAPLEEAASALEGFVDHAALDPRIDRRMLDDARLDLALVWTLLSEPRDARDLLAHVDPNGPDVARRLAALAIVKQALGDLNGALAAAEEAARIAPESILPIVQQALLFDEWIHDEERAEEAWKRALELARSSTRLVSVLERTRAGVRLERYAALRAKRSRP